MGKLSGKPATPRYLKSTMAFLITFLPSYGRDILLAQIVTELFIAQL